MKMSDILRDLAELLDQQDGQQDGQAADMSGNSTQARMQEVPADMPGQSTPKSDDPQLDKMVPPLQQKLELLKKVSGVDNEFDKNSQPDELARMKQMAGIQMVDQEDHE